MTDRPAPPPRSVRLRRTLFDILGRWSVIFIVGTLGATLLGEIAGVRWPVCVLTPFVPQLAVGATAGVIGLLIARRIGRRRRLDRVWLIGGTVVALYAGAIVFGFVPWRMTAAAPAVQAGDADLGTIKVLSSNVYTANADHESILNLIERENPDVILLMELSSSWLDDLTVLKSKYPTVRYVPDDSGNFGIGFWTRLPVSSAQLVVMEAQGHPSRYDVPQVDVTLLLADPKNPEKRRPVRFVGLHPLPPMNPGTSRARDSVLSRTATLLAEESDVPTIVAGDLNATPYCRITRTLATRARLRDALTNVHYSWPIRRGLFDLGPLKWVLAIRIDQVLVSDGWRVVESHKGPRIGSDHYPVVTTLRLAAGTWRGSPHLGWVPERGHGRFTESRFVSGRDCLTCRRQAQRNVSSSLKVFALTTPTRRASPTANTRRLGNR